ncbi:hypothetical protein IE4803_CH03430 [Rhizobium etli bv. phaseoli str. IE4803]|uniref:Uncharacterized protein n=1 Tax=Rhizobium etli bv. mimosae str. IE4771 TaxID=1432050 RepID=A0A060I017_RHIET|nr:hypothetical protein [Rhizobium sp. IE4771]AIC28548.1 hypothetical protein IE4771_CH03468 [Rhizobium sp. IE4771]AJC80597.1 hypothetical protein IE4803_CH03430 [Rhizobium etli bv. phaseoli str. IE4803]
MVFLALLVFALDGLGPPGAVEIDGRRRANVGSVRSVITNYNPLIYWVIKAWFGFTIAIVDG